jgi:RHS repeat-associated protein
MKAGLPDAHSCGGGRSITTAYNWANPDGSTPCGLTGYPYLVVNATYAPHGALASAALGNGMIFTTYTYNSRLQPVNSKAQVGLSGVKFLDLTYNFVQTVLVGQCCDDDGNLIYFPTYYNNGTVLSVTNNLTGQGGRSQTYTYDEMNRLATAQSQATTGGDCWGQSFGYDRYANLLSIGVTKCTAPALSLSVNSANNRVTNTGYAYDAAGNVTADGTYNYTWNAEGRMTSAAGVNYTYDGDGKRVKKDNGKLYWYGPGGEVLAESDLSGNVTSEYIYFGGTRIARKDPSSSNVYYYLADRLGSAKVMVSVNLNGTVNNPPIVSESDFYPYGGERVVTADTTGNTYKFTGHERDAESGLDHTLFRQESSNTGRWLSPDPMDGKAANPQSWNRYSYVTADPLNYIDPLGLCSEPSPMDIFANLGYLKRPTPAVTPTKPEDSRNLSGLTPMDIFAGLGFSNSFGNSGTPTGTSNSPPTKPVALTTPSGLTPMDMFAGLGASQIYSDQQGASSAYSLPTERIFKRRCDFECTLELAGELLGCVAVGAFLGPEAGLDCSVGAAIVYAACCAAHGQKN